VKYPGEDGEKTPAAGAVACSLQSLGSFG